MDSVAASPLPLSASRCWTEGRRVYLQINERRSISFPASKYATLATAPQSELSRVELLPGGRAIQWVALNEEIQVEDVAHQRYFHTARSIPARDAESASAPTEASASAGI